MYKRQVFDEFHERSLSGDLSLGRVLDLQEGPRPDMAVAVMSAPLEISGLRDYMGASCRVLEANGRQYPVETVYRAPRLVSDGRGRVAPPPVWEQAADAVKAVSYTHLAWPPGKSLTRPLSRTGHFIL